MDDEDADFIAESKMLTVAKEEEVDEAINAASADYSMAEAMYHAAEWRIARDFYAGTPVPGTELRLLKLPSIRKAENPALHGR